MSSAAAASQTAAGQAPARARGRRRGLIAIVLVGLAYATMIQSFSWNQTSHYDLIRVLDRDTTTIDAYQTNTGDKAFYRGHWYSARAPGLALFALPFYNALNAIDAKEVAVKSQAQQRDDEMIYFVGLWGNVLPGLLLLALVWKVADEFAPGYGAAGAVALGLGTMVLPLSTLLFSHVFSAFLGFAAFALLLRERAGPPSALLAGLAGLAMGYAISSEYPLFFVAVVLGLYLIARADTRTSAAIARRAGAYAAGGFAGIAPLLLYNHYAFRSWTHLAYSNVPRQKKGFFGIEAPSPKVLSTLLFDSRGLLTISPVLVLGGLGTFLLYRRGRRAEALTITAVCLCYTLYNSGYYLPFGGGFMGPRFMTTMLPFLACPLGLAFKRWPAPAIALAGVSIATTVIATATHPLVGYETETILWTHLLGVGTSAPAYFQPTIATAIGLGRGWKGIWPFFLLAGAACALALAATPRLRMPPRQIAVAVGLLVVWALFAALAPTLLGIDHQGLLSIVGAGDHTALHKTACPRPTALNQECFSSYPLRALAPIAAGAGLVALVGAWLARRDRGPDAAGDRRARAEVSRQTAAG